MGRRLRPQVERRRRCVNALRSKLGPDVVETVRGAGYRLPTSKGAFLQPARGDPAPVVPRG